MYSLKPILLRSLFAFFAIAITLNGFTQSGLFLIPEPKQVTILEGVQKLDKGIKVYLPKNASEETIFAYTQLEDFLYNYAKWVKKTKNFKKADIIFDIKGRNIKIKKELGSHGLVLPEEAKAEGYILEVKDNRILISAETEAGLFYGVQTLKQLISSNNKESTIPNVTIIDWPSLKYRGWMDDISRGPIPTMEFLKECIHRMAEYKQNFFTLYTENVYKFKAFPDMAPADGLTANEVSELTEYAAKYHIDMIGNFQSFGHMAKILANPFYTHLGENADILNPADESTYTFLKNAYSEIVPAYKSPFFNINCDETFGLGEGKSKALAEEIGIDGIYASHINRIDQLIKPYGKRIMMWGDIAVNNPAIITKLPKDLIILSWGYDAAESFDKAILPFKNTGFDFMVAPGVSCWNEVWPGMANAVINISNYTRDGYKLGSMGMMNTAWDDNGHNLFNSNWHGLIWGAECSWSPLTEPSGEKATSERNNKLRKFNSAFDRLFFNTENVTGILMAIDSLRSLQVPGILSEWAFWTDITDFKPDNTGEDFILKNQAILKKTLTLSQKLSDIRKQRTKGAVMIDNAGLALDRIAFTANKNITRALLYKIKDTSNPEFIARAKTEIIKLKEELFRIKKNYISLWEKENRAWWLDKNLNDYNKLLTKLDEAENRVFIESAPVLSNGNLCINMKNLFGEGIIVYTTDGTEPTSNSSIFNDSLQISNSALIKARTIINGKPGPVSEKYIIYHKGIGCLKELHSSYSTYNTSYSAGGASGLLDGLKGSSSFSDGRWQGYQQQDLDIEIDLKSKTIINSISIDFLQNSYSWILLPKDVEIQVSEDGNNYTTIKTITHDVPKMINESYIHKFAASFQSIEKRFLRIIALNPGPLPVEHHATGNQSFIFADEIIIN